MLISRRLAVYSHLCAPQQPSIGRSATTHFHAFPGLVSQEGKPIVRSRCQMASMPLSRPEKSAGRHGDALVDADHTIKMCFNPATAPSPSINGQENMKSDLVPDEGFVGTCCKNCRSGCERWTSSRAAAPRCGKPRTVEATCDRIASPPQLQGSRLREKPTIAAQETVYRRTSGILF